MIHDSQPTLEELRHYGVLGMKWGKSRAKATGTEIRKARRDFEGKRADYWDAQKAVRKTTKRGSAEREAGNKKTADMRLALLKDPDRVTASRLTRGEKAIYAALAVTGVGTAPALVALAGTSAVSRRIEKKQDDGAYDKKK
jgi:hypothetical protein